MSKNKKVQDEILDAFNEAKEEQLDLLDFHDEEVTVEEKVQEKKERVEAEEEKEEKFYIGADGTKYTEEEWNSPVVRNGPLRKEVEGWKKRYKHVYFTPFEDEIYVWRTLQRPEYREIIRDTTLTALDREELFTEKCVLYPYDFSLEKIKKSRAGIASLLAEMIMDKSGFVAQSAPIKL